MPRESYPPDPAGPVGRPSIENELIELRRVSMGRPAEGFALVLDTDGLFVTSPNSDLQTPPSPRLANRVLESHIVLPMTRSRARAIRALRFDEFV
jgi:hypothetical protein